MIEALITLVLIATLVARELVALERTDRARRRARLLGIIAAPLLVAFLAISLRRLLQTAPPAATPQPARTGTPAAAIDVPLVRVVEPSLPAPNPRLRGSGTTARPQWDR